MHVALAKWPINQFKTVQVSRQQKLRARCPNIYSTVSMSHGSDLQLIYTQWPKGIKSNYAESSAAEASSVDAKYPKSVKNIGKQKIVIFYSSKLAIIQKKENVFREFFT